MVAHSIACCVSDAGHLERIHDRVRFGLRFRIRVDRWRRARAEANKSVEVEEGRSLGCCRGCRRRLMRPGEMSGGGDAQLHASSRLADAGCLQEEESSSRSGVLSGRPDHGLSSSREVSSKHGLKEKRLTGKKSHQALRSSGRLIRLDRRHRLVQQESLKV